MLIVFFFQAEDGIRDLVRSRGLGDVYKRQTLVSQYIRSIFEDSKGNLWFGTLGEGVVRYGASTDVKKTLTYFSHPCLLYTSDAADERSSVDLGGRRIIKKKKEMHIQTRRLMIT